MKMITGSIVVLAGAILWGLGAHARGDTATGAIAGGIALCVVGLVILGGYWPKEGGG